MGQPTRRFDNTKLLDPYSYRKNGGREEERKDGWEERITLSLSLSIKTNSPIN